ncbi:MAG: NUDIX domain-containing protein [Deltaproteobacteria bacterium]|nr:NUDIX domain-containing protein [Deltaproteobacteria bacterium]MBK8720144.1 NUDIX domain-containing protein [Deltaproteobacteria bacterium]MBP7289049.1 NUDIX domain-containing protein [Nannocystaceae bacterium]
MAADVTERQSDLALVLARVEIDGAAHWLLRRHAKWGDWSLVGGHVEADERDDWMRTAIREANEELAPLVCNVDFTIEPLSPESSTWGPVASRSAGGAMTTYRVRWYQARFLGDAAASLRRLSPDDFALVLESEISDAEVVSSVARRLFEETRAHVGSIPVAARVPAAAASLRVALSVR